VSIELTHSGVVGYITLDKPPANSYDRPFMEALSGAIEEAGSDDAVKVVVVRSSSSRFFSAGADVKAFKANGTEANMEMVELAHRALARIGEVPKVFVAQIEGHALGGGLEIALACDLRFGARGRYTLGLPEVTLGLLPGNGGTQRLPRLIGASRALDLMVTGRQLTPGQAHAFGILDRLLPAAQIEAEVHRFGERLAAGATRAIGEIKLAVHEGIDRPLEEGLAIERARVAALFDSADAAEGIEAFLDKRKPQYTGA
jgi:enoyl-CoA hydratase/carnithine racemase